MGTRVHINNVIIKERMLNITPRNCIRETQPTDYYGMLRRFSGLNNYLNIINRQEPVAARIHNN